MRGGIHGLNLSWRAPIDSQVAANLSGAAERLRVRSEAPRLEAELLLAHVLGCTRAELHTRPEHSLLPEQSDRFERLLARRLDGEPLPYLTRHIEFYGLDFAVDPRVLIPRPETETLVDLALSLIPHMRLCTQQQDARPAIADVGTGSGCLVIALATRVPNARYYALDLSPDALSVARTNARRHRVSERITFLESNLLAALPERVDLILANPPYIAADEWPTLPPEVRKHEPFLALDGGRDGLDLVRRLLRAAPDGLRPGGALMIEIGATQGPAAANLARRIFRTGEIALHADLAGRDRVLCVRTQCDQFALE